MTSKQLREQLAALIEKGRAVLSKAESEKRTLTAEDSAKIGRIHSEAAGIKQQIEVVENQEKLESQAGQIPATVAQATARPSIVRRQPPRPRIGTRSAASP